ARGAPPAPDAAAQSPAAVEEIERPLASIRERIQTNLAGVFEGLQIHAGFLGATIKDKLGGAFTYLSGLVNKFGGTVKTVFSGLGTFIAGFSVGAIRYKLDRILDETVDKVQKLGDRAAAVGIPVEKLQELTRWAEASGIAAGTLDTNLVGLDKTLGQIAAGKNKDAAQVFKDLKIDLTDVATGQPRQAIDILRDLATAMQGMPDAQRVLVGNK